MYILSISKAIRTMLINDIKDFIFINCYNEIGFYKKMRYKKMIYNSLKPFKKIDRLFYVQVHKKYTSSLQC